MKALVFSPCIAGHRHIYCAVVSDWFLKKGFEVIVAAGNDDDGTPASKTPILNILSKRGNASVMDLGNTKGSHLIPGRWVDTVRSIEEEMKIDRTFIVAGDECRISLDGLGEADKTENVKRQAIFTACEHFYFPHLPPGINIRRLREFYERLKNKIGEDDYFNREVWGRMGLNAAFSTNPDFFAGKRDNRFCYLPEIYRAWGFEADPRSETGDAIERIVSSYKDFLSRHTDETVILYYGGWTNRRGYSKLLELAASEPDTIFVSCGRRTTENVFSEKIERIITELKEKDKIFQEKIPFFPEGGLADILFNSCDFVILPYDNFYRPSGILIQASSYGRPVLVPDIGYLGSMVKKFRIGLTYRNNDQDDFNRKFRKLRLTYKRYIKNAEVFGQRFGMESVHKALDEVIKR